MNVIGNLSARSTTAFEDLEPNILEIVGKHALDVVDSLHVPLDQLLPRPLAARLLTRLLPHEDTNSQHHFHILIQEVYSRYRKLNLVSVRHVTAVY